MTELQIAGIFIAILLVMILMRIPIGISLIAVSFGGLWSMFNWNIAWGSLGIVPYSFANSWVLSSIPAFLFMGFICYHTRLTQGLFNAAQIWLSGLPGGLAIASVFGCAGFAAVTGSSVACSAAMGKIAVPEMTRHRYSAELATGTVAAAGTIGALIPPSILMILYGIISRQSVSALFLGGLVVGLITLFAYILLIIVRVKMNPDLAPPCKNKRHPRGKNPGFGPDMAGAADCNRGICGAFWRGLYPDRSGCNRGNALNTCRTAVPYAYLQGIAHGHHRDTYNNGSPADHCRWCQSSDPLSSLVRHR